MIKEFAVEPAAIVSSYRDFSYILEKCGLPQGRVIAQFPSTWKRSVYEAAQAVHAGSVELTRITERLQRLPKDLLFSSGRNGGDPAWSWIERVRAEHEQRSFDWIVATENPGVSEFVSPKELDDEHPALIQNRQWSVPRTAEAIATACAFHWRSARHVKIIDPYFDPKVGRFSRPFELLLGLPARGALCIDFYRSDKFEPDFAIQRFQGLAQKATAKGHRVRLFLRPDRSMHNRYFLTDLGGITFLTGLDDSDFGASTESDDVMLLERQMRDLHWNEYEDAAPVFEWK